MTRRVLLGSCLTLAARGDWGQHDYEHRIYARINEVRVQSGAGALRWSDEVAVCAHEQSLRKERLRFAGHNDPERGGVSDRLLRAGIPWSRCGENLFQMQGFDDPVHFAVVNWWYSPGHKQNLLNPEYTETGVGVVQGADKTFFVTQIFATPPELRNSGRRGIL